ncbi:MAG: glycosyltransferase family 9 protein [Candidatus Binataceae bacterium]
MTQPSHEPRPQQRVLVIFPGALGDLVLVAPTLRALARRHRGASLELMAREELANFAVGRIGVARAHSIDRRELSALFASDVVTTQAAGQFFADFSHIYSFFAADDRSFRDALSDVARHAVVSFHRFFPDGDGHVASAYAGAIGEPGSALDASIAVQDEDVAAATNLLSRLGLAPHEFVLIHPGSGSPAKNWPARNFSELANRLAAIGCSVLIVVGPAEERIRAQLADCRVARVWSPPLSTLAGLARLARAYLGNDCGVSHLAAAAGAASVVLFGPTDPARWRPLGRVRVMRGDPIESISIDQALGALDDAMNGAAVTE